MECDGTYVCMWVSVHMSAYGAMMNVCVCAHCVLHEDINQLQSHFGKKLAGKSDWRVLCMGKGNGARRVGTRRVSRKTRTSPLLKDANQATSSFLLLKTLLYLGAPTKKEK